jgi:hypothetical protein
VPIFQIYLLLLFSGMKTEASGSSRTMASLYETIQCHIPEDQRTFFLVSYNQTADKLEEYIDT